MFDNISDVSHTDQMFQIICYMHIEYTEFIVKGSIIDSIQLNGKSGKEIIG